MTVIRQRTVETGTIKLKRLKNNRPGLSNNKWMYVVEFPDGDRTDPRFNKQNAIRHFNDIVDQRAGQTGFLFGF